jgi:hypothetical protein
MSVRLARLSTFQAAWIDLCPAQHKPSLMTGVRLRRLPSSTCSAGIASRHRIRGTMRVLACFRRKSCPLQGLTLGVPSQPRSASTSSQTRLASSRRRQPSVSGRPSEKARPRCLAGRNARPATRSTSKGPVNHAGLLTPGLTHLQAARLRDDLMRLTRLPQAPMVYMDADRIAGRYMLSPHAAEWPTLPAWRTA